MRAVGVSLAGIERPQVEGFPGIEGERGRSPEDGHRIARIRVVGFEAKESGRDLPASELRSASLWQTWIKQRHLPWIGESQVANGETPQT